MPFDFRLDRRVEGRDSLCYSLTLLCFPGFYLLARSLFPLFVSFLFFFFSPSLSFYTPVFRCLLDPGCTTSTLYTNLPSTFIVREITIVASPKELVLLLQIILM